MEISEKRLFNLIDKMINIIKPKGVLEIDYNLTPLGFTDNEYYMNVTYVVPDDSEYLRFSSMRDSDNSRISWNREIKNTIKNYFDVDVIINSSGIQSETYYNKQKEY
jgi:hypothetical protein